MSLSNPNLKTISQPDEGTDYERLVRVEKQIKRLCSQVSALEYSILVLIVVMILVHVGYRFLARWCCTCGYLRQAEK